MAEQQVRGEALIFLLAGHETMSTALTFALYLLAQHSTSKLGSKSSSARRWAGGRRPNF